MPQPRTLCSLKSRAWAFCRHCESISPSGTNSAYFRLDKTTNLLQMHMQDVSECEACAGLLDLWVKHWHLYPSVLTAWPHVPATAMPESADRSSCMTSAHWFPILVELVWNGGDMWEIPSLLRKQIGQEREG